MKWCLFLLILATPFLRAEDKSTLSMFAPPEIRSIEELIRDYAWSSGEWTPTPIPRRIIDTTTLGPPPPLSIMTADGTKTYPVPLRIGFEWREDQIAPLSLIKLGNKMLFCKTTKDSVAHVFCLNADVLPGFSKGVTAEMGVGLTYNYKIAEDVEPRQNKYFFFGPSARYSGTVVGDRTTPPTGLFMMSAGFTAF